MIQPTGWNAYATEVEIILGLSTVGLHGALNHEAYRAFKRGEAAQDFCARLNAERVAAGYRPLPIPSSAP